MELSITTKTIIMQFRELNTSLVIFIAFIRRGCVFFSLFIKGVTQNATLLKVAM